MERSMLLAVDGLRAGESNRSSAVALAKTLDASIRALYLVDAVGFRPGPPCPPDSAIMAAGLAMRAEDNPDRVPEARAALDQLESQCRSEGVAFDGGAVVAGSRLEWGEGARSHDLLMVRPVPSDFGPIRRFLGTMFPRLVAISQRPVILSRSAEPEFKRAFFFYGSRKESSSALPWVKRLCPQLAGELTVFTAAPPAAAEHRQDECRSYLESHGIPAAYPEEDALDVLHQETVAPGKRIPGHSLMVLGGGLLMASCLTRRRRVAERLILTRRHDILLCP